MKSLDEQREKARECFYKLADHDEKNWNMFWLGWLQEGYKIAYEQYKELEYENN